MQSKMSSSTRQDSNQGRGAPEPDRLLPLRVTGWRDFDVVSIQGAGGEILGPATPILGRTELGLLSVL